MASGEARSAPKPFGPRATHAERQILGSSQSCKKNSPCLPSYDDESVQSFQGSLSLLKKEETVTPEITGHMLMSGGVIRVGGGGESTCLTPGGHLGSSHLGLSAAVDPLDADPTPGSSPRQLDVLLKRILS